MEIVAPSPGPKTEETGNTRISTVREGEVVWRWRWAGLGFGPVWSGGILGRLG
jgi:hypothetical protein